jgi:hypothetical protein
MQKSLPKTTGIVVSREVAVVKLMEDYEKEDSFCLY